MAKKHTRVRVLLPLLFSALAASAFAGSTVVGSVVSSTETVIGGHPVFVGNTVFSGDTLKIGDGAAEVALAGGSLIILARETEATFERESDRVTVQLGRGMVTLRSGADEAARIRLAVGGIMVEPARGTATLAQVSLSGRDVTVSTKEGSLEVERFGRRVELPKGKAIKILPANQAPSPSAGNPQGIGLGRLAECAALGGIVSVAPVAVIHVISPSQPNWEWGLTPIGPVAGALICMELPPPPPPNPGAPGNPPKCELAADPAEIETPGTEVKLTWKYPEGSKGVKLWEGGRIKQDLNDPSGSVTVNPRSDTNYSVQGKGPDGKDFKCQATVALRPFKCDLCARYDETTGKFTLRWTAKKASSAVLRAYTLGSPPEEIPGEAYEAPAGKVEEGDKEVDPASSRRYELTVTAAGKPSKTCSVTTHVPTCAIWAERATGGGFNLRWRKYDVSGKAELDPAPDRAKGERYIFSNAAEGGAFVKPTEETTYTLTVTSKIPVDSCDPRKGMVELKNECPVTVSPLSCSLNVEPRQVDTKGKPTKVELTWTGNGQKAELQTLVNGNPAPPLPKPQPQPPNSDALRDKKLPLDVTQTTEFVMTVTGSGGQKATCHACVLNRPEAKNEKNPEVKILDIPPKFQQKAMWCWLTVAQMIFQFQKPPVPKFNPWKVYSSKAPEPQGLDPDTVYQWGILAAVHPECWLSPDSCALRGGGSSLNIQRMLREYPPKATEQKSLPLYSENPKGCLDAKTIKDEIRAGRPIIAGISPGAGVPKPKPEHVALIIGYQEDEKGNLKLIINDPWPFQLQKGGGDPYVKAGGTRNCEANYTIDLNDFCTKLGWSESFIKIQPQKPAK